jgi:hypothetical protein
LSLNRFPQGPFLDQTTGQISLEWVMWLQNPEFVTVNIGTVLDIPSGGLGVGVLAPHGVVIGNATSPVNVTAAGALNTFLRGNGNAADPTFGTITLASADFANQGTATTVLHGNAVGNPSFSAVDLVNDVTGTVQPAHGGTGVANNAASTITIAGNFPLALTLVGSTTLTLPSAGTLVSQTTGSWTPADGSGAALAFSAVSSGYTQTGNMIDAYATVTYPVTVSGAAAIISGLPVPVANQNYAEVPAVVATTVTITGGLIIKAVKNTTTAKFDVGSPFGAVTNAQLSGATVTFNLTYPVA